MHGGLGAESQREAFRSTHSRFLDLDALVCRADILGDLESPLSVPPPQGLSIGRCNKGSGGLVEQPVQCLSGGLQLEGGTGPFVQGVLDACEVGGGVHGQVAAFGEPMP